MNRGDDEGFLARWSRRKSETGDEPDAATADRSGEAAKPGSEAPAETRTDSDAREPAAEVPFDISSLPSIESIQADTDLTPFFRPGVPSGLRHAALRRMWVTDPAIRDFVGLQEYDWDFNSGDIPGFGAIGPDVDVRAMAERLLGGGKQVEQAGAPEPSVADAVKPEESFVQSEPQHQAHTATNLEQPEGIEQPDGKQRDSDEKSAMVQRDENAATQDQQLNDSKQDFASAENSAASMRARRHGSALPS